MLDQFEVHTLDQMKSLSSKVRVKILNIFADLKPRCTKQVASELALPIEKVRYHMREMHRVGLLNVQGEAEMFDVVEEETYYLPVARKYVIKSNAEVAEGYSKQREMQSQIGKNMIDQFLKDYRQAQKEVDRRYESDQEQYSLQPSTNMGVLYVTPEEKQELEKDLLNLYEKWMKKQDQQERIDGAIRWQWFISMIPLFDAKE